MAEITGRTPLTSIVGDELLPIYGAVDGGGSRFRSVTPQDLAMFAGCVVLAGGTLSAAATLDIPIDVYWPNFSKLQIELLNFLPVTEPGDLRLLVSADGGSTFDNGSGHYKYAHTRMFSGTSSPSGSQNASAAQIELNTGNGSGQGSGEGMSVTVQVSGWGIATKKPRFRYDCDVYTNDDRIARFAGAGLRDNAQVTTDLRFLFNTGNIASGSWRVIGFV